jgi:hypothetical protein
MDDATQRPGVTIEGELFNPVTVRVGGYVWITQQSEDGESLIIMEQGPAQRLADAITLALAKVPTPAPLTLKTTSTGEGDGR